MFSTLPGTRMLASPQEGGGTGGTRWLEKTEQGFWIQAKRQHLGNLQKVLLKNIPWDVPMFPLSL